MAWSWRKRKTIIPGVRLNFGRKGISTTIGPRGASMTFGPNGTYLNTSLPRTGLYNRRKIGQNNSTTMANNNSGCGIFLLAVGAFLIWELLLLVILTAFLMYDYSYWWLGIIFCVVTIVTHIIVHQKYKQKTTTLAPTKTITDASIPTASVNPVLNPSGITYEYFQDVNTMVALLISDSASILKINNLSDRLNSLGVSYNYNGKDITDNTTKLMMLFWIDIIHCYYGLNNNIDLHSKSGFGLFDFIVTTLGHPIKSISAINASRNLYMQNVLSIVNSIRGYYENNIMPKNEFYVVRLLSHETDLRKLYLTHMFRFASLAARADNEITEQEADWLASIVKIESSSSASIQQDKAPILEKSSPTEQSATRRISSTSIMKELNNLIGLASVKEEVESLTNFIKVQQTRSGKGMKTTPISYHCVFTGNPGTGKTTVARILAEIYKKLGVISKGHLVETDRAGLVAEYVGQTAVKTNKIIDSALDGVLFIDEAYSLVQGSQNDYGKEAIATLLKRMEDDRDRLVVIIAGYTNEMKDFINANPGLQSRFNRYIEFPDYSAEELFQIYANQAKKYEYVISNDAAVALLSYFEERVAHKDKHFGNGRDARNVFEKTLERQANRLARENNLTNDKLVEIIPEDLPIQK